MPFPTGEEIRKTVEDALGEGLALENTDWMAGLPDGSDLQFRPGHEFEIRRCLDDDELATLPANTPAERVYKLRLRVELVAIE